MPNIINFPAEDRTKREAALDRDVVERMTGRTGLSARVRLALMDIIMSAHGRRLCGAVAL